MQVSFRKCRIVKSADAELPTCAIAHDLDGRRSLCATLGCFHLHRTRTTRAVCLFPICCAPAHQCFAPDARSEQTDSASKPSERTSGRGRSCSYRMLAKPLLSRRLAIEDCFAPAALRASTALNSGSLSSARANAPASSLGPQASYETHNEGCLRTHTIVSCCAEAKDYGPSSGRDAAFPTAPECAGTFALAASALLSDPSTLLQTLVALLGVTSVYIRSGPTAGGRSEELNRARGGHCWRGDWTARPRLRSKPDINFG